MQKQYNQEKGYTVVEMWQCEWWNLYKADVSIAYKRHLHQDQILDKIISGPMFRYVQCDNKVSEQLWE